MWCNKSMAYKESQKNACYNWVQTLLLNTAANIWFAGVTVTFDTVIAVRTNRSKVMWTYVTSVTVAYRMRKDYNSITIYIISLVYSYPKHPPPKKKNSFNLIPPYSYKLKFKISTVQSTPLWQLFKSQKCNTHAHVNLQTTRHENIFSKLHPLYIATIHF